MPLNVKLYPRDSDEAYDIKWTDAWPAALVAAIAFESVGELFESFTPNQGLDYPRQPQGLSFRNVLEFASYPVIAQVMDGKPEYIFEHVHYFVGPEGEEIRIKQGDRVRMWRA